MAESYLLLTEVAKIARASISTVRHWIRVGKLPSVRPGRRRLIRERDLDLFLIGKLPAEDDEGDRPQQGHLRTSRPGEEYAIQATGVTLPPPPRAPTLVTNVRLPPPPAVPTLVTNVRLPPPPAVPTLVTNFTLPPRLTTPAASGADAGSDSAEGDDEDEGNDVDDSDAAAPINSSPARLLRRCRQGGRVLNRPMMPK